MPPGLWAPSLSGLTRPLPTAALGMAQPPQPPLALCLYDFRTSCSILPSGCLHPEPSTGGPTMNSLCILPRIRIESVTSLEFLRVGWTPVSPQVYVAPSTRPREPGEHHVLPHSRPPCIIGHCCHWQSPGLSVTGRNCHISLKK